MCSRSRVSGGLGVGFGIGLLALLCVAVQARAVPSNLSVWTHNGLSVQAIGARVGTAGDFNCDGKADLLLGAPDSDYRPDGTPFWTDVGWIGVYFGNGTLPPQPDRPPDWVVVGNGNPGTDETGARLGARVAAGDVNRDGCDDIIATTERQVGVGELVLVYFGAPTGPSTSWGWRRFINGFGLQAEGSVASGDVNGDGTADVIVGAPDASLGQLREGAVLVWLGSQFLANTPDGANDPDWIAESNQIDAALGTSVASGDVNGDGRDDIVAGAPGWDGSLPGSIDTGIALMWSGSPVLESAADGTPANAAWSVQIGTPGARLGASVAVAGDVDGDGFADILAGAPSYDNPFVAGSNEGTVVVTRGAAPAPGTDVVSWFHPGQASGARLGYAVASAGDVDGDGRADYLIAEPDIQLGPDTRGRVHLLLGRPTASWGVNPATDVFYTEAGTGNATFPTRYAWAIGTAGDWNNDGFSDVVIGAAWMSSFSGRAYVYLGRGDTLASAATSTLRTAQPGAIFGLGVAFAGDINHDGFTDIVTGAPGYEDGPSQEGEGRFFVTYGGPCGPDCAPFQELLVPGQREGNQAGAQLGWSVSSAGDVNGDGYADVVVGAPGFDTPIPFCIPINDPGCQIQNAGQARIYLGGPDGLAFAESLRITGSSQAGAQFGYSVANAGDVNGDGFGDVIVGSPTASAGFANEGRVSLFLGSASGLSSAASWTKHGGQVGARLGIDVAGAGDVNGDGYSDVIVGADGFGGTGAAYVYLGRPTNPSFPQGLANTPVRTYLGQAIGSEFGLAVASAGDVNRDGFADVIIGEPGFPDDPDVGPVIGRAVIIHGGAAGPGPFAASILYGTFPVSQSARFGSGVAGAGDVNGDGYSDVVVGDQWSEGPSGFAQGAAYVFHGGASGVALGASRTLRTCPDDFCDFGRDVSGAGDVNGDGFSDVLVGAYRNRELALDAGAVYLHLGNETRGTAIQPLQSLGFAGAPRALLGSVSNWFDVSMNLKSPAGRSRVTLEIEVKPIGQNFDGLNTLSSVALDSGSSPRTALSWLGAPNAVFHWRARLRSASPLFGRSRWLSLPENAPREMDVRVVPEPGFALLMVAGVGALATVARSRRGR